MDEGALVRWAAAHHGVVSRAQAHEAGVSDRMIQVRLRKGTWQRVRTGVYRLGAVGDSWHQQVFAACVAAGPDASASHRTAARLHRAVDRSGRIEILLDNRRRVRLPGVVTVHRSVLLPPEDRTLVDGVPTTTLARTIVDLAPMHPSNVVGRWIDLGLRDQGLTIDEVAACAGRLWVPGRPVPRSVFEALAIRRPGHDPGRSALESRAIAALARAGLPEPVRQFHIERPDGSDGFLDLALPDWTVAIELDGWDTHGLRSAFDRDRIRGNDIVLLGWDLLRFTASMSDDYFCRTVEAAIARRGGRS